MAETTTKQKMKNRGLERTRATANKINAALEKPEQEEEVPIANTEPIGAEIKTAPITPAVADTNAPAATKSDSALESKKRRGRPITTPQTSKHRGLHEGWERTSTIVRTEYLNILKDYAYTKRISIKDALDDALGAYIATIDTSELLHRSE